MVIQDYKAGTPSVRHRVRFFWMACSRLRLSYKRSRADIITFMTSSTGWLEA